MADFKLFWPILLRQEGYYANDKDDKGGETWEGIARNMYPAWSGWAIVDAHRPPGGFIGEMQANAILKPLEDLQVKVLVFYKSIQWDTIDGDQIQNQSIANFMADWGVNAGMSTPVKHAQKVLSLDVDGKMGPHTLAAINSVDGPLFFSKMQAEREQFYMDVVTRNPQDKKFLNEWLQRNQSFKYST